MVSAAKNNRLYSSNEVIALSIPPYHSLEQHFVHSSYFINAAFLEGGEECSSAFEAVDDLKVNIAGLESLINYEKPRNKQWRL